MAESLSILDKIKETEKNKQLHDLDLEAEVQFLLTNPRIKKDRDREVVSLRFGLNGEKAQTLEEIGKNLGITRERVRQIEKATFAKLIDLAKTEARTVKALQLINAQIKLNGGAANLGDLCILVLCANEKKLKARNALKLLMALNGGAIEVAETNKLKKSYIISGTPQAKIEKIIQAAASILDDKKEATEEKKLLKLVAEKGIDEDPNLIVASISLSKEILRTEEGHFGLSHWREINPKSIKDKTYYILRKHNKPLHFSDIAKHVETLGEGKKKVTKQAVHNELIRDERFILIGRGIYALREWGYKDGVIEEVIEEILFEANQPLHKNDIIKEVMKRRIVKETTILLNLQKNKFKRVSRSTYTLNK